MRKQKIVLNILEKHFAYSLPKAQIKEIAAEIYDALKPQKKAHPAFSRMSELFHDYAEKSNATVIFTSRHGKALNEIISKLENLIRVKNESFTQSDLCGAWEVVLQNLPDFYRTSFDICAINNKLGEIITQIKNARPKQGIDTAGIAQILRDSRAGSLSKA